MVAEVFGTRPAAVKIGIFGVKGEEPVDVAHHAAASTKSAKARRAQRGGRGVGITVAQLASIHEFGSGRIPARSFVRSWFDENQRKIRGTLLQLMAKEIARAIKTGRPITDATRTRILEQLGLQSVGQIQARISRGIAPPLKAATIERKGSSTPLIDTGQLRASVTHLVSLKGRFT